MSRAELLRKQCAAGERTACLTLEALENARRQIDEGCRPCGEGKKPLQEAAQRPKAPQERPRWR